MGNYPSYILCVGKITVDCYIIYCYILPYSTAHDSNVRVYMCLCIERFPCCDSEFTVSLDQRTETT